MAGTQPKSRRPSKVKPEGECVIQLLVTLEDTNPSIWRRIQVPDSYTFRELHYAIQDAMGWDGSHLHGFSVWNPQTKKYERLGTWSEHQVGGYGFDEPGTPEWEVTVSSVVSRTVVPTLYEYDFGDTWEHEVRFEGFEPADPSVSYPRCIDGAMKCPPEDVGGVGGYYNFLEAIRDKKHPEHRFYVEWMGDGFNRRTFDPEAFDPKAVKFCKPPSLESMQPGKLQITIVTTR